MKMGRPVGALQLTARLRGVSPPVTRRLLIEEQAPLSKLHAVLQVAFGWSGEHLYTFQIRGWQFANPATALDLALSGGGADIPLAAFGFEIGESFLYQYSLSIPWGIDCRVEARALIDASTPVVCWAARGHVPDEDLPGPSAYPDWFTDSEPGWVMHQIQQMLDEDLDEERFRAEARDILTQARRTPATRRVISNRLQQLRENAWDAGSLYEDADPADH
jgi:Plasmid pRiA4b ORF-3-like protein